MSFLEKAVETNFVQPYKRVTQSVGRAPLTSKPQTLFAELGMEVGLLSVRNITQIMNWTGKSMAKVLGGTLKTGLLAASLIPLPIPGGSIAGVQRDFRDTREAFNAKVQGDPRSFKTIVEQINLVRRNSEEQAMQTPKSI